MRQAAQAPKGGLLRLLFLRRYAVSSGTTARIPPSAMIPDSVLKTPVRGVFQHRAKVHGARHGRMTAGKVGILYNAPAPQLAVSAGVWLPGTPSRHEPGQGRRPEARHLSRFFTLSRKSGATAPTCGAKRLFSYNRILTGMDTAPVTAICTDRPRPTERPPAQRGPSDPARTPRPGPAGRRRINLLSWRPQGFPPSACLPPWDSKFAGPPTGTVHGAVHAASNTPGCSRGGPSSSPNSFRGVRGIFVPDPASPGPRPRARAACPPGSGPYPYGSPASGN